jgi:hypothetical protein
MRSVSLHFEWLGIVLRLESERENQNSLRGGRFLRLNGTGHPPVLIHSLPEGAIGREGICPIDRWRTTEPETSRCWQIKEVKISKNESCVSPMELLCSIWGLRDWSQREVEFVFDTAVNWRHLQTPITRRPSLFAVYRNSINVSLRSKWSDVYVAGRVGRLGQGRTRRARSPCR